VPRWLGVFTSRLLLQSGRSISFATTTASHSKPPFLRQNCSDVLLRQLRLTNGLLPFWSQGFGVVPALRARAGSQSMRFTSQYRDDYDYVKYMIDST
jgi:hypothetical protein